MNTTEINEHSNDNNNDLYNNTIPNDDMSFDNSSVFGYDMVFGDPVTRRTDCYNALTHIYGFTGIQTETIVISMRGTDGADLRNWIMNFDISLETFFSYSGKVHSGFVYDYMSIRSCIINSVALLLADHPSYEIKITGHSLGGSLSLLTALDLIASNVTDTHLTLYTFG